MSAAGDRRRPLPAVAAVLELARQALIRAVRGRGLWVVAAIAALPAILALILSNAGRGLDERTWERVYALCILMLVVVPPVLVAAAVADELEDKTSAYLWSRALARWTVVVGKLVALAPLCAGLLAGSAVVAYAVGGLDAVVRTTQLVDGALGLAGAGAAAACIAAAIATLVPRHAVAVTVGWMLLVDTPLGSLDVRLHHLSTSYGAVAIAGVGREAEPLSGALTLVALAAVSTALACWRIGKLE